MSKVLFALFLTLAWESAVALQIKSSVSPAEQLAGLKTALVEDKVIIVAVDSDDLRTKGLAAGQELVTISGIPARKYAEEQIAPYQFASTPQDLAAQVYSDKLLAGPKDEPIDVGLTRGDGKVVVQRLARSWGQGRYNLPLVSARLLDGNVAYVAINSFNDPKVVEQFDQAFEETVRGANALILDVRNNSGGNSNNGYAILGYLTDRPHPTSRWQSRSYVPAYRSWGRGLQWRRSPGGELRPNGKKYFDKRAVVLTGPRTYSAAEDFCVAFSNMQRGPMVGGTTGGSTGNPLFLRLPGGGGVTICSKLDSFPDGSQFVGLGINPDVRVTTSVEDIRAGRDPVLEAAMKQLSLPGWISELQMALSRSLKTEVRVSSIVTRDDIEGGDHEVIRLAGEGALEKVEDPFGAVDKIFKPGSWERDIRYDAGGHGSSSGGFRNKDHFCIAAVSIDSLDTDEETGHIPTMFTFEVDCRDVKPSGEK